MMAFSKKLQLPFPLAWIYLALLLPCLALSEPEPLARNGAALVLLPEATGLWTVRHQSRDSESGRRKNGLLAPVRRPVPTSGFTLPASPLVRPKPGKTTPIELECIAEGPYLSLYTSGRLLRQNRYSKSGVWNTPARKLTEMWVKRKGAPELIRLGHKTYRRQLVELLADFPEIHGAIRHRSFTYKKLAEEVPSLNDHIRKVISIRKERGNFQVK